jgi:hypothetical protein
MNKNSGLGNNDNIGIDTIDNDSNDNDGIDDNNTDNCNEKLEFNYLDYRLKYLKKLKILHLSHVQGIRDEFGNEVDPFQYFNLVHDLKLHSCFKNSLKTNSFTYLENIKKFQMISYENRFLIQSKNVIGNFLKFIPNIKELKLYGCGNVQFKMNDLTELKHLKVLCLNKYNLIDYSDEEKLNEILLKKNCEIKIRK